MQTLWIIATILAMPWLEVHAGDLLIDQACPVGDLAAAPLKYDVLLPDGHNESNEKLPLLLFLHGGGEGNHVFLRISRPWIEELWTANQLPPMVIATPHVGPLSFYLDFKDGTQKWESIVLGPFLQKLRAEHRASSEPQKTLMMGVSMGGAGTLHMGLKRPKEFRAIAAIEPAVQPTLTLQDLDREMFFWFNEVHWRERYGNPIDGAFWEATNPASIAAANAESIRTSALKIFLECGDQDYLNLHKGTEFLHRVLWDRNIQHEYRSHHGADHIGESLKPRVQDGLLFLANALRGSKPESEVLEWRKDMDYWRQNGHPRPKK